LEKWRNAALQGLGVLVGILIAFGIDAWWDGWVDRQREAIYLQALATELEYNEEGFAEFLGSIEANVQSNDDALELVATPQARASSEEIQAMAAAVGPVRPAIPETAALTDMLTSGGIGLTRDPVTRRLIARYARVLEQHREAQDALDDLWNGSLYEYFLRHGSLVDMPLTSGARRFEHIGGFTPDVGAFAGNREFANLLVYRGILLGGIERETRQVLDIISELRAVLARGI